MGSEYLPECSLEQRIEYLDAIRQSQQKIQSLRTALKKETQFNRKLNLNMQIKSLEKQYEKLVEQI